MVEDRIRDGRRIAQLLASELTGLTTGPLGAVSVVDADPDAQPATAEGTAGTRAYDVEHTGEHVATVRITERAARVAFADRVPAEQLPSVDGVPALSIEPEATGPVLVVESGAGVKRALDVLADVIE